MAGWFPIGVPSFLSWQSLKIGAGGLITGIDMAPDGTMVCRTDVFGGYYYNASAPNPGNAGGTGAWQQLCTTTSLASASSLINTPFVAADGLYEIRVAPSNSTIFYMVYLGYVWISSNRGSTWTQTAFTRDTTMTGGQGAQQRVYRYKMAVDPINADVVHLATFSAGVKYTLNGTSSATWTAATGIVANDSTGLGCVVIDPSSSNTSGRKSVVYVSVSGHGLYKSTDGGVSYSSVTGGPGTTATLQELQISSNGTVFVVDFSNNKLWRLVGSTWTDITPTGGSINCVSINPSDPNNVIAWTFGNGGYETSTATSGTVGGGMWGTRNSLLSITATDVPWLATLTGFGGMLCPVWDQTTSTKIWCSAQQGVLVATYPLAVSPSSVTFTSVSSGIEEIVANDIVVPPGGNPIVFGWDMGLLQQTDVTKYGTAQGWNTSAFLSFGSGGDYASNDSTFICQIVDNQQSAEVSGYSTSSGTAGTWQAFASFPTGAGSSTFGGSIAASTSQKMIWVLGNAGTPWYTGNQGASWTQISGLPTSNVWDNSYQYKRHIVAADRVTSGRFYIMATTGYGGSSTITGTYVVDSGTLTSFFQNTIDLGANSRLRAVPSNAGHLFFTSGPQGSGGDPASNWPHNQLFYYSHDGGQTWTDVSNLSNTGGGNQFTIREVWGFGFGKEKPGGTYPVIYIYGWVASGASPSPSGSTPAVYKSEDNCVTWTQIGNQFPDGWPDYIVDVNGDPNIYGRVYAGRAGSGWIVLR